MAQRPPPPLQGISASIKSDSLASAGSCGHAGCYTSRWKACHGVVLVSTFLFTQGCSQPSSTDLLHHSKILVTTFLFSLFFGLGSLVTIGVTTLGLGFRA